MKNKFEHTTELFKSNKILNVYKPNIFNIEVFQGKSAPNIFFPKLKNPFILKFVKPIPKLNECKYEISYRGPFI